MFYCLNGRKRSDMLLLFGVTSNVNGLFMIRILAILVLVRTKKKLFSSSMVRTLPFLNMLELANRLQIPILLSSTSEVYGDPNISPQVEEYWGNVNPIGIRACYDEGKRAAETLFFDYWRQHNLKIKVVRLFNTYGPRMHPQDGRVVSNFIVAALAGQPITLYGDGSQTRSFCYVDDLLDGLIAMMASPDSVIGPINLGNPGGFTVKELGEIIKEMTKSPSEFEFRPLPQDDPIRRQPDITRAQETLGWSPKIPLREGLATTIDHFRG